MPLFVGLGFIISAGGTCYVAYKEEQKIASMKSIERAINDSKEILKKTPDSLIEIRDATHQLEDRYNQLELKLAMLNATLYNNSKHYNLLANSMHYFESLKFDLIDIDREAANKRISSRLKVMLQHQVDWPDDLELYSDLQICRYA